MTVQGERPEPGAGEDGASFDALVRRCARYIGAGRRSIVGITGAPGAGKSTLAGRLAAALGPGMAVVVPMDGFHLANEELARLGRAGRKGAIDTFDGAGYVALLARLRACGPQAVYAPRYTRTFEEAIAGAIRVDPQVPMVLTEGNYLLDDAEPWAGIANLLDETWFLEVPDAVRLERLIARHVAVGKSPADARAWALGPDAVNARRIAAAAPRATLRIAGLLS